jgi:hypothetical protein
MYIFHVYSTCEWKGFFLTIVTNKNNNKLWRIKMKNITCEEGTNNHMAPSFIKE